MPLKIAFQMNALTHLNKRTDSTLYVAAAAARRGHTLYHYEPQQLRLDLDHGIARVTARVKPMLYNEAASGDDVWQLGAEQILDLASCDVILMRQDPPFDLAYISATHILELLRGKVRIVNDPIGVRNAPEKLLITHFPHLLPPTLVTRDSDGIRDFRSQHGDIIIKPLHGFAGHGVFHLKTDDDNFAGLVELMGSLNNEPWMIQKFLPVAEVGDKRIVMLNGDPVGIFRRMPAAGDVRGNMRVGGRAEACPLSPRDQEICAAVKPTLIERGLYLVGLDVIGDYLTEINVTSPTGLLTADQLQGRSGADRISEQFWDFLEK